VSVVSSRMGDVLCSSLIFPEMTKAEMEPGLSGSRVTGSPGQRFWPGRVGSRGSVPDPAFGPVLSFNICVYRGVVSTA